MALAALSGPEVLVLLPLSFVAVWRWRRERPALVCIAVFWLAALAQLAMVLSQPRASLAHAAPPFVLLRMYAERFFLNWVELSQSTAWAATALIAAALLLLGWKNRYWFTAATLAASAVGLLIAGRSVNVGWANPFGNGTRYAYAPFVLAAWAIGWLLAGVMDGRRRAVALVLLALIATSSAVRWVGKIPPNYQWQRQVAEVRIGMRDTFQIPGVGMWEFAVPRRHESRE